jgi:hypothetical protein
MNGAIFIVDTQDLCVVLAIQHPPNLVITGRYNAVGTQAATLKITEAMYSRTVKLRAADTSRISRIST